MTQHGKSAAVLLDPGTFQEIQDQIEFMRKVTPGLDDLKKGKLHIFNEVVSNTEKIISDSAIE